ncbi:hypothetical protein U9M48_002105 [Paspalum notatum var. saurae]|uniref:F-box protein n=1 Tax=Paspalum notatum var. saurae TaxID=547442 RepID=A0AAQ3SJI1_PASNO
MLYFVVSDGESIIEVCESGEVRLCLWSRKAEDAGWVQRKAIDLKKVLPLHGPWTSTSYLVGSAEGVGAIFLTLNDQLFMIDIRSCRMAKVFGHLHTSNAMVVPYMSFTPGKY